MTIGCNQPYFFPYLGFWQLINISDIYVIADSMQYIKQGYINRNNMLINGRRHLFTLEVSSVHMRSLINEVKVGKNARQILKSIFHAYKKAPYFEEVYPMLEEILLHGEKNLAKYVGYAIERTVQYLDIDTKMIYLSDLQGDTLLKGQDRVIDICKRLNADHYINSIGGQKLYNKEDFLREGIKLNFIKSGDIEYKQFNHKFIPNLSIIDVMMFNSKEEIEEMLNSYELI
ncbi:WbqC family protein [Sulfurovum sp. XGS-02]|uniref:WbqC family protein n=1 Tax=Sulfurovum sp. XGS-02 TaxID=2925411 RepID=UPI0020494377|nr:WbqC family protein [Sulfurovum sp. XGS-02]UPT76817.1 WbqC family protein [Sulfurovum sp. XGS-02]